MEFSIIEVEPEWALDDEPMGSKDKFWLEMPDDPLPWLFKYSRINQGETTGEHWSEKLAAELADLLKLDHAKVELAYFAGKWGCISRMFDSLQDRRKYPSRCTAWYERRLTVEGRCFIQALPETCISKEHRWFVGELLKYNYARLGRLL